jgi:beta-N-acetylhexosaminidase
VLFSRNFESRSQLNELVASIHQLRHPRLLLAVDQEGGRVQRFIDGFTRLPPLGSLGTLHLQDAQMARRHAYWHGRVMAMEMLDSGIDISFAPVLDLDRGSSVIGDRALSGDPDVVIELGGAYLDGMHDAGMRTTGKHFPGHGSVQADSHIADVCDDRSLAEIKSSDMRPFVELVKKLDAMMIAHVEYPCLDERPAGYSEAWLGGLLRQQIGFDGVIFSDDLGMHAAKTLISLEQRTRVSLEAGCDAVLACQPEDVTELLCGWNHEGDHEDVTERLQALYGLPSIPRGKLNTHVFTGASQYQQWRTSLEKLT